MKRLLTLVLTLVIALSACLGLTACKQDLVGFDIDLAKEVCAELDLKVEFKEIDWDVKETELSSKAIDCVWNGFTYTEDRDNGYFDSDRNAQIGGLDFTNFYMENKQVAVVKKDAAASFTSNASFAGKTGCAEASSAGESVIKDVLKLESKQLGKQLDVFTAVKAGTYDFGVVDLTMASEYIASAKGAYNDSLAIVNLEEVESEFYAIAFREGSNMTGVFNYVLAKLYANGKAAEVAKNYALDANLYDGFKDVDTANYSLPTDGDYQYIKDKGTIIIGYTIFAPMAYIPA